ncbi:hypothetical protein P4H61_00835 [Paenibacillus peoriae]|uniref:hypothetical protein n=1 Tax=Paenibacillus peoriae TaxID=59893 RepID=UPI001F515C91|nr:hypothetical protein [Paenibacillus peoriae]MEC0180046.1 hypothetical protein [Paenibacillus peoriae]
MTNGFQTHTQSAGEHTLGKTAQTVIGYGIGLILPLRTGNGDAGSGISSSASAGWGEHVVGIGGGMLSDNIYTIYSLFSGNQRATVGLLKLANRRSL